MSKRNILSAAEIKQDVAININNMTALALQHINKAMNLGCILVSIQIISLQGSLVPRSTHINSCLLTLCKS